MMMPRSYRPFFKMPQLPEFQIAAYAAVAAYEQKIRSAGVSVKTTLLMKENWLSNIIIPQMTSLVENIEDIKGMTFDLAIDLSDDRAISIGSSGKTAAYLYGALMGLEYTSELIRLPEVATQYDLCILAWNQSSIALAAGMQKLFPEIGIIVSQESEGDENNSACAIRSKVVFGRRSAATYLAACANRAILEGYPLDEYPKDLLSKWANARYNMFLVEQKQGIDFHMGLVNRSLERILRRGITRQSGDRPAESAKAQS